MPLELGVWRIDGKLQRIVPKKLDRESRLEDFIHQDVTLVRDDLWVIGRQVPTAYGHFIDLLAINAQGSLSVLELKRDKTPREVVAQTLDYGSWVAGLKRDDVERIYEDHATKFALRSVRFDAAFEERFGTAPPEVINGAHELIIVASELDPATERIIGYLSEQGVLVNAVFFRVFADGDREYLTKAWLKDPGDVASEAEEQQARREGREPWNGTDFYFVFGDGEHRNWEDARAYGFVAAGGKPWYSRTLRQLQPGHRVFVHIPERGYVGVGRVTAAAQRADQFTVTDASGDRVLLSSVPTRAPKLFHDSGDDALAESLVGVEWIKTVSVKDAYWEKGFFANQNSTCKLRNRFTIERLTELFRLEV